MVMPAHTIRDNPQAQVGSIEIGVLVLLADATDMTATRRDALKAIL